MQRRPVAHRSLRVDADRRSTGQGQPDRPGADDGDAEHRRCAISASISAIVLGAAAVRISQPAAVTSASSSMRTPMFHSAGGTSSAARM